MLLPGSRLLCGGRADGAAGFPDAPESPVRNSKIPVYPSPKNPNFATFNGFNDHAWSTVVSRTLLNVEPEPSQRRDLLHPC